MCAGRLVCPTHVARFGRFGGRFVPEALVAALDELDAAYRHALADEGFQAEFGRLLRDYAGVPSLLYDATRLSTEIGTRILLKREDLNHTGAHKIRNVLGQALMTKRMGKKRVIAETGAGQHGVATATAAALFGLECVVYMGEVDTERQALNVARMKMLGAKVVPVRTGSRTLKDAINEATRDWVTNVDSTHYIIGTAAGPHPVPGDGARLRPWHRCRGPQAVPRSDRDAARRGVRLRRRRLQRDRHLPRVHPRRERPALRLRAGRRRRRDRVATRPRSPQGTIGVLHGARSYLLQDDDGQTIESHSISAGLDYPGVGPEHAWLKEIGRATYEPVTDAEAMDAFALLSRTEGIIPAIESAHALAGAFRLARSGTLGAAPDDPGEPLRSR